MAIKSPINTLCKAFLCIGFFFSVSINAQHLNNRVLIDGGDDIISLAGMSFESSVYLHAYNYYNNAEVSFLYKVNEQGVDSILMRDFNDSITYGFRQCFEKDGELYWIGTYDFPQQRQYHDQGVAIVKTDTNLSVLDRIIIPKQSSTSLLTSKVIIDDNNLYICYSNNSKLGITEVDVQNGLSLVIDTIYDSIFMIAPSLIKIDDELRIFGRFAYKYESVSLPSYELLGTDSLYEFSRPFSGYQINRLFHYQDSLILGCNLPANQFMILNRDFDLIDTVSIQSNISSSPYSNYYNFGSEALNGKSFYYGGTNPTPSILSTSWDNDIMIIKIHDFKYEWDCLISEDSTNITLSKMYFSNDSTHIFLQYMEYDMRKNNLGFNIVVTMMDTMCNILSTHKIAKQKVDVLVYPNPTSEAFTFKGSSNHTYALALYNLSGKAVLNKKQVATDTAINVDHLPAGMYMLHVQSERNPEQVSVIKIVVQ